MTKKSIPHAKSHRDLPNAHYPLVMAEITKQTDRGAAIVAAAYIDLFLRWAIESRFLQLPDIIPGLFENRGPLQDFSARIHVGFAMGLYKRRAFNDLKLIRDIRNAFAHSAEPMEFTTPAVAALCDDLWLPKKIHMKDHPDPKTPRESYLRAIEWLTDGLFLEATENRKRAVIPEPWFLNFDAAAPEIASPGKSPKQRRTDGRTQK